MNFSLYIAKRYIFSKKSHNAINVISLISVIGISVATMAMICVLSILNGFNDVAIKSFSAIDPDLKITPVEGKVFDPSAPEVRRLRDISEIEVLSETLEDNALIKFRDRQTWAQIKGIAPEYLKLVNSDRIIRDGEFVVKDGDVQFGVIGGQLAMDLGVRANFIDPIEIFAPKRNVRINLANPNTAFGKKFVYPSGVFVLNQEKYDNHLLFVSLEVARELFRYENEVSALELKLENPQDVNAVKAKIKQFLGDSYYVKDRFEQQEEIVKMVNVEKWVTFLLLIFLLIIAIFNIIGSLSMLILEKEPDVRILQNLGAKNKIIGRIFMIEGWMINFFGCMVGLFTGIVLCLLQQHFGLLKLGPADGTFIIDAYPVLIQAGDIAITFVTVNIIGFVAVTYPVSSLRKRLKNKHP